MPDRGDNRDGNHNSDVRWRQFATLLEGRRYLVIGMIASSVVAGICESLILALVAESAAALANHQSTVRVDVSSFSFSGTLSRLLMIALLAAGIRLLLSAPLAYLPARLVSHIQSQVRRRLFLAFTHASWAVQSSEVEGSFQELMTGQASQVTDGAIYATNILTSGCMLAVLIVSALAISPAGAAVVIAVAAGLSAAMRPFPKLGSRYAKTLSSAQIELASGVHQSVDLAEETHVFGSTDLQTNLVDRAIHRVANRLFITQFLGRLAPGIYQSLFLLLIVSALSILAASGTTHFVSLGAVVLLLVRASLYSQQCQGEYQLAMQALPYLDRLSLAERKYQAVAMTYGSRVLRHVPSISFQNVSYSYGKRTPALLDINFDVEAGRIVGVVGPTGAGKSTLVQLLLGLRSPDSGQYLIEGESAFSLSQQAWRRIFAYVPQEPRLLRGTVAENISFYRNFDMAAVERAARLAHVHEDIESWPLGYQTVIGPRADAVSGGQRQRICLARALAGNPYVLVLDEPTSSLDPVSEMLVQESLAELKGSMTMLIVAHRFSTLDLCDEIMVIKDGRLDGCGPVTTLRRSNQFYQRAGVLTFDRPITTGLPN
jgi:ATP-binding cassette subfamily B protein